MEKRSEVERPVWMYAIHDKWIGLGDAVLDILLLSYLIAAFSEWAAEWMLWLGLGAALCTVARFVYLVRSIRRGKTALPEKSPQQRWIAAWLSVGCFLLFGVVGLLTTVGAPWYIRAVLWTMASLSVVAGVCLYSRKR